MYHVQLFSVQPKERVAPAKDERYIHKQFIVSVLLLYVRHFVFKYLPAGCGININIVIPENVF